MKDCVHNLEYALPELRRDKDFFIEALKVCATREAQQFVFDYFPREFRENHTIESIINGEEVADVEEDEEKEM